MFAPLLLLAPAEGSRLLFVGNSLLNFNDVPGTVAKMVESARPGQKVTFAARFVSHLEDVAAGSEIEREIGSGKYDVVVLQGAMVSTSHKFHYPQDRGISLAKLARKSGARMLLYAEWSRKGIDETEYTLNVYRQIAAGSGAEIVPVGLVWDEVRRKSPNTELWQPDGNHANELGSFVAAASVCAWLESKPPRYVPVAVPPGMAKVATEVALRFRRK